MSPPAQNVESVATQAREFVEAPLDSPPVEPRPGASPPAASSDQSFGEHSTVAQSGTRSGLSSVSRVVGAYELLDDGKEGGMGVVFKAHDLHLDRIVALKRLRAGTLASQREVLRFYREAQAAAKFCHPNIVPIYEVGEQEGLPYFTMPYVTGGDLRNERDRLKHDPRAAVALMEKVARAVQHLHQHAILHRDLKPGNILLDERGEPLVSDFGLAKLNDPDSQGDLTPTGAAPGTPEYMAPEQTLGRPDLLTAQCDVWALGVILYELLTGRRPFDRKPGEDYGRLWDRIRTADPQRPRSLQPKLDPRLEAIVLKCLEKEPGRRYATAEALAEDLERWRCGEAVTAKPEGWPRRVWRKVRRRAPLVQVVALLLLVLATSVVVYVASVYWDPAPDADASRRALHRKLAAGERVTLIGETGQPEWYHWRMGEAGLVRPPPNNEGFAFQTLTLTLLELVDDPQQENYRFSAEVRHDDTGVNDNGTVGIYFLQSEEATPTGPVQCFCEMTFAERGFMATKYANPDKQGPRGSQVEVNVHYAGQWQQQLRTEFTETGPTRFFVPQVVPKGKPAPWHQLAAEVSPEGIQCFWDGLSMGGRSREDLLKLAEKPRQRNADLQALRPAFAPRSALGLFAYKSSASFRRVALEPLPPRAAPAPGTP